MKTSHPALAVLAALVCGAAAGMHIGKAAVILPHVSEEFSTGISGPAIYIAAISAAAALVGLAFGRITAAIGPRRAALVGLAGIALGSFLGAMSGSFGQLLASRIVEAASFPFIITSIPPILQRSAPPDRKALIMGIWSTWLPGGVALALAASVVVMEPFGWRGLLVASGIVTLLGAAGLLLWVDPDQKEGRTELQLWSILRTTERRLWPVVGSFLLFSVANMAFVGFIPSISAQSMGLGPTMAAITPTLAVMAMVVSNVATGWAVDRGLTLRTGFGVSFLLMAVASSIVFHEGFPVAMRVAAVVGYGLGAGVPPTLCWAALPGLAAGRVGAAPLISGLLYQGVGIGQVIGPVIAGAAVDRGGTWDAALPVVAGSCVMALCLALIRPLWSSRYARI